MLPNWSILNRELLLFTRLKAFPVGDTEADIDPLAILFKFNPVIPEAGMLTSPEPSPVKVLAVNDPEIFTEPEKIAGPILVKVLEPETVKDPVITTLPEKAVDPVTAIVPDTFRNGVAKNPEFASTVPVLP